MLTLINKAERRVEITNPLSSHILSDECDWPVKDRMVLYTSSDEINAPNKTHTVGIQRTLSRRIKIESNPHNSERPKGI